MKLLINISVVFLLPLLLTAQNYVPNPSFETLNGLSIHPNPRNHYEYEPMSGYKPFQKNLKFWYAGSQTTPDLRINDRSLYSVCNSRFRDCDKPHRGQHSVGFITSLKNTYTETYREYLQVKLTKILKPGLRTYVEAWVVKEREAKLVSNNIGFYFSYKHWKEDTEEVVHKAPQVNCDTIISSSNPRWVKIEGSFVPDKPLRFLSIGNFFSNDSTTVEWYKDFNGNPYTPPYAYYLIDDVRVWQEEDSLMTNAGASDKPATDNEFTLDNISKDKAVVLENIYFHFDRASLKPESIEELEKLRRFLLDNADLRIAIHGHTDNAGRDAYNLSLSKARAKAVVDYLLAKGIAKDRLRFDGFGEQSPIDENGTEEGRARNRRVEFLVLD